MEKMTFDHRRQFGALVLTTVLAFTFQVGSVMANEEVSVTPPAVEVTQPITSVPEPEVTPVALTGWQGQRYLVNGVPLTGAQVLEGKNYFFDLNGDAVTGLLIFNEGNVIQFYQADRTQLKNGSVTVHGVTYNFDANGNGRVFQGGLRHVNGQLQFVDAQGQLYKNRYLELDGARYYFDGNGNAVRGFRWHTNNTKLEYYGNDFKQFRGRYLDLNAKDRYYFNTDGMAHQGFRWYDGNKKLEYYGTDKKQWRDRELVLNGVAYYFKEDGDAFKGLRRYQNRLSYYGNDFKQFRDKYLDLNGKRYYFKADGNAHQGLRWYANGTKLEYYAADFTQHQNRYLDLNSRDRYYFKADGDAHRGPRWYANGTKLEYYGTDYKQYRNKSAVVDGRSIFFGDDGDAVNLRDISKQNKAIAWFEARKGKVRYSMASRLGPWAYDCSSAIYLALKEAGLLYPYWIGNTETLFVDLEANGWKAIPAGATPQRGDIFIWGKRGTTLGAGGHTGIFTGPDTIIHCNYPDNGIAETPYKARFASSGLGHATIYRKS